MEKKKPITISELDVEPLAAEDLDAVLAAEGPWSSCGCIDTRSDSFDPYCGATV